MGENMRTGRLAKGLGPVASRVSNEQGPDHQDVDGDEVDDDEVQDAIPDFRMISKKRRIRIIRTKMRIRISINNEIDILGSGTLLLRRGGV